jgi:hypothetical protein
LSLANEALTIAGYRIWLLLDRLDVAFSDSAILEINALRALFRVYLDLRPFSSVQLKIFLRTDVWKRITSTGFREASHVTRHLTINWTQASLMNLVVRRAAQNQVLLDYYNVRKDEILSSQDAQQAFFDHMFPAQVDVGPNKSSTFAWMLSRTRDGSKHSAPREIIHLLNHVRDLQVHKLELGDEDLPGRTLFSRTTLKEALPEVSRTRLEQTLYAEYPELRESVEQLRAGKTQYSGEALAELWGIDVLEAYKRAKFLVGWLMPIDVGRRCPLCTGQPRSPRRDVQTGPLDPHPRVSCDRCDCCDCFVWVLH